MTDRKVELLAPAGSYESMKAGVCAGADAIYMGGTRFGARAFADNPDETELLRAIDYVHIHGRKFYLTVNTLLKDSEMDELYTYLKPYYCGGIDGVIVQDTGVIEYVREYFPGLPIHASTQMTVTNTLGAKFLKDQGVVRVVPARELSLAEIRALKEGTGMEVECFVHGALCYCYSGQCLFSSIVGGRSGNRGQCAQPCRLPYQVGDGRGEDCLSLKDLCAVDIIPDLIDAGVDSFKIEGRMKQPDYVYTVTGMYRRYIDLYLRAGRKGYTVSDRDRRELTGAYQRRGYTKGYYHRQNGAEMIASRRPDRETVGGKAQKSGQDYKIQEKLKGKFILSPGRCAKLMLECRGRSICAEGAVAERALRQPLETGRIEKQMRKTGNTEFVFEDLEIICDGDVFLPMQSLNELRRDAISQITEELLLNCRRREPEKPESGAAPAFIQDQEDPCRFKLSACVCTRGQLEAALDCGAVERVYIESVIAMHDDVAEIIQRGRQAGVQMYFAMPHIFRTPALKFLDKVYDRMERCFDGVLLRNFEGYGYLTGKGYAHPMTADGNLYLFNRYGRRFLRDTSIGSYTAPAELNAGELSRLGVRDCALVVYGRAPMMVTANCLRKNTEGCDRQEGTLTLTDRCQKKFIVKNVCNYCYNIIYNCVPLVLLEQKAQIERLCPRELRLDFTVEDRVFAQRVLAAFASRFAEGREDVDNPAAEYTRGHFKRGVK